MFSQMVVTLDIGVLAGLLICAGGAGAVALHGVHSVRRRIAHARDRKQAEVNLVNALRGNTINREINDVSERAENTHGSTDTLVRARIDRMREVQQIWGLETRQSALKQVAAIMKRSVRSGDEMAGRIADQVDQGEDDSFTILVRGAAEKDGSLIAKRLHQALARTPIQGLSDNIRLNASFGVASRRAGESLSKWHERAEEALSTASARDDDHIVEASECEEVKLLPPPSMPAVKTSPKAA